MQRRKSRGTVKVEALEQRLLLSADVVEQEPNDVLQDANRFSESGILSGVFATESDQDLFVFSLGQGDSVTIDPAYAATAAGDRQFFVPFDLLDSDGTLIVRSRDVWQQSFVAAASGDYYIRFHTDSVFGAVNQDYAARVTLSSFAGVMEVEPNDTRGQATAALPPLYVRGQLQNAMDRDVFSFDVQAGQVITVDLATAAEFPQTELFGPDAARVAVDSDGLGLAVEAFETGTWSLEFSRANSATAPLAYVASVTVDDDAILVAESGDSLSTTTGTWTLGSAATRRAGVLSSMDDVDVYAVHGNGLEHFRFDLRSASADSLAMAGRRVSLLNEYGQLIAYAEGADFRYDELPALSTPGRYLLTIQATSPLGLGAYSLAGSTTRMFAHQRDTPLYFFDFDQQLPQHLGREFEEAFQNTDVIPFLVGWFETLYDRFDVDVTTLRPFEQLDYIAQGIGQFEGTTNNGSGHIGYRTAAGDSVADSQYAYNTGTINHEFGHATTLNHVRDILQQVTWRNIGKGLFPGSSFGFSGNGAVATGNTINHTDQADWVLQSGSQITEPVAGGVLNLNPLLRETQIEFADGPVYSVDAAPHHVVSGDFNGDGWKDLATANSGTGSISVLFSAPDGQLSDPIRLDVGPDADFGNTLAAVDVDGDQIDDLVHADYAVAGTVSVWLGATDRVFQSVTPSAAGSRATSLAAADFNGDGRPDLAVANYFNHTVSVLSGNGDGTFSLSATLVSGGRRGSEVAVADLTNDGLLDIILADQLGGTLTTFFGEPEGSFGPATDYVVTGSPQDMRTLDLNGDAFPDLATIDSLQGTVDLYFNDGSGGLIHADTATASPGARSMEAADVNGDGRTDLIVPARDSLTLDILINKEGTQFSRPVQFHAGGARESGVLVTDWNGDSYADIWLVDNRTNTLRLLTGKDNDLRDDRVVVHGQIDAAADVDEFELTVVAGDQFSFDIDAAEFQYPLNAALTLTGPAGNIVASNATAMDRESGFTSVDPYLVHTFQQSGTFRLQVHSERQTTGKYRLKVTHGDAFDTDGPRLLRAYPQQGQSIEQTRQLLFWFNDKLDPESFSSETIRVIGASSGVRSGTAYFDPLFNVLIWQSDTLLPLDNYSVTLDGLVDLRGNRLDGELPDVSFPRVSGDGVPGGSLSYSFQISSPVNEAATVTSLSVEATDYNTHVLQLRFSDHLDMRQAQLSDLELTAAGPDNVFGTADDWRVATDLFYARQYDLPDNVGVFYVLTRGFLESGRYRLDGTVVDEAGFGVTVAETLDVLPMTLNHGVSVVDLSFQPGQVAETSVRDAIEVRFSNRIDRATLTPDNFRVRYSADTRFFETDDVLIQEADGVIDWDGATLTATFQPAVPLQDGFYLVELIGQPGGITDLHGNLLDGEYLDSSINGASRWNLYPDKASGDGRPGGDYRAVFGLAPATNQPPTLDIIGDKSIDEGGRLIFTAHATD
ncbi:MAG: FG-GAP-like repeat-containing protein, partial [Fuerstiella sp.]